MVQKTQNPPPAMAYRFESGHRHHQKYPITAVFSCFGYFFFAFHFPVFSKQPKNQEGNRRAHPSSSRVDSENRIGRSNLGIEIQMGADVGCGGNIAVSHPLLNLFQAHTIGIQQAGTAVSKGRHAVRLEHGGNMGGQISGLDQFTNFIHTDVSKIVLSRCGIGLP